MAKVGHILPLQIFTLNVLNEKKGYVVRHHSSKLIKK